MVHTYFAFKKHKLKTTTKLSLIVIFVSLALAAFETVWPVYFYEFEANESVIGFISSFIVLVSIFTSFYSSKILEKYNEQKVFLITLIFYLLFVFLIPIFKSLILFIIFSLILTFVGILRANSFSVLFRKKSNEKELSKDEGFLYSVLNIGWFLGPLIAGYFMVEYSNDHVFYFISFLLLISLYLFIFTHVIDEKINFKSFKLNLNKKSKNRKTHHVIDNIKDFFKEKKLYLPLIMLIGVEIWWAIVYIYIPIFIIKYTKDEGNIGLFLALIVIPLIIFDFETGKLAKKYGLKYFFMFGFLLLSLFSLTAFYLENFYLILVIFVIASFAVALIEPINETFYFKSVNKKDEDRFYPIFSLGRDIGSFVGKFSIASVLLFFPDNYSYLTIAILMFIISIAALFIKE